VGSGAKLWLLTHFGAFRAQIASGGDVLAIFVQCFLAAAEPKGFYKTPSPWLRV